MSHLTILSDEAQIHGFRYLWLKTVVGFDPTVHCAKCLRGHYHKQINPAAPVNQSIDLKAGDGDLLYLCGVSAPYNWDNNLHLAARVKPGAMARVKAHTGDIMILHDCEPIAFDDEAARERFPDKGRVFLTCRNYQFGAFQFQ
jgi:hypothetical protein